MSARYRSKAGRTGVRPVFSEDGLNGLASSQCGERTVGVSVARERTFNRGGESSEQSQP